MNYANYIALIPLLPLAAFLILGLLGKKHFRHSAGIVGTSLLLLSTILAFYTAYQYFFINGKIGNSYEPIIAIKFTWLTFSENLSINMGILLDAISVMMLVVVTFVSLMVHLFSLWYMKGEERFATFYAFLGLFTFSMLGLILSTNLVQMYMFWELVGASSYLLIGFYFQNPSAVAASKKAFIVTRFADFGLLIGILILAFNGGSLEFNTIIQHLTSPQSSEFAVSTSTTFLGISALTWALVLLFIGGAGKSAMFPLHIWLPDAMEGPTPVSALIHAATMVVAGVFLVARLFPVFSTNNNALTIVTIIGVTSALFAAIIACTQTDIKRVLAYSTMSQIGYMMFALGVSGNGSTSSLGYTASMFHLFTHACFKSLLFLGAGAVIHFVHSNEMKKMGGLRKYMPITHFTFLIACLAITGIWPFAGFFSKEEILMAAYNKSLLVYSFALFTSALTAFYMFRLYFSIFWNKEKEMLKHQSEGTFYMKLPLLLLAICTTTAGFIPFGKFISANGKVLESKLHLIFSIPPLTLSIGGIALAWMLYKKENTKPQQIATTLGTVYKVAYKKFYIDEVYVFITKKFIFNFIGRPAAWFDRTIIDGLMNTIAAATAWASQWIKPMQSGKLQNYLLYFFGGIIALVIVFIYIWKP